MALITSFQQKDDGIILVDARHENLNISTWAYKKNFIKIAEPLGEFTNSHCWFELQISHHD